MCEFARQSVKVALSGDGADELFGGYGRYFSTLADELHKQDSVPIGHKYYSNRVLVFNDDEVRKILGGFSPDTKRLLSALRAEVSADKAELIDSLRMTDVTHYLPGAVLAKVDRMSMQYGLEVRTPFLNIQLADFAARLPAHLLANPQHGKVLLKRLAERYYPPAWVNRRKQGFGLPTNHWSKLLFKEAEEKLLGRQDRSVWWLDKSACQHWLDSIRFSTDAQTYKLWNLLLLDEYLLDNKVGPVHRVDPLPWLALKARMKLGPGNRLNASAGGGTSEDRYLVFCHVAPDKLTLCKLPGLITAANWTHSSAGVDWLQDFSKAWSVIAGELESVIKEVAFYGCSREDLDRFSAFLQSRNLRRVWLWEDGEWKTLQLRHIKERVNEFPALIFDKKYKSITPYTTRKIWQDLKDMTVSTFYPDAYKVNSSKVLDPLPDRLLNWQTPQRSWQLVKEIIDYSMFRWQQRKHLKALHNELAKQYIRRHCKSIKAKILFVLPNLSPGGAERQACNLLIQLKNSGYEVKLLTLLPLVGEGGHYQSMLRLAGIEIIEVATAANTLDLSCVLETVSDQSLGVVSHSDYFVRQLLSKVFFQVISEDPDLVVNFLDLANLAGGIAALLAGVPKVLISFRNVNPTHFGFYEKWYKPYYRALLASPRLHISGNSEKGNLSYSEWLGIPPARIMLFRNGVDIKSYRRATNLEQKHLRAKLGFTADGPVLGGVFRLSAEKRPELFVEVFQHLAKKMPDIQGFIAGGGNLKREIEAKIKQFGLANKLIILGAVADVSPYLSICSALLQTSIVEGTANSLLEAQLLGVPVIATAAGGSCESLDEGKTGYLINSGKASIIAAVIAELLADKKTLNQMQKAGPLFINQHFSLRQSVATLEAILQD